MSTKLDHEGALEGPKLSPPPTPGNDAAALLHELQVHQIELETQNEALRQAQVALEESRDRYADLYDFAPVGYFTLSDTGLIAAANLTGAALLGFERKKLVGRRFDALVGAADQPRWRRLFIATMRHEEQTEIEVALTRRDGGSCHARLDCRHTALDGERQCRVALRDNSAAVRERQNIESALAAASARVESLYRKLIDVEEDARRRLSGELHDRTSPNLAAVKINLKVLATMPADKALERAELFEDTCALVADTDVSIRAISTELRPPLLDHAGLPAALASYARQFARRNGVAVEIECLADARLASSSESLLFRICQETLTNCAKHAQAKTIRIRLNTVDRPAVMTIEDDGVGFDPQRPHRSGTAPGLGLCNMQEMAEFGGGRCVIESQPGRGTRVEVVL